MRSLIVLALAGVAFALALVMPHREAARRLQFEEAARERLLEELATPGGRNEWEEGGYRFHWHDPSTLRHRIQKQANRWSVRPSV